MPAEAPPSGAARTARPPSPSRRAGPPPLLVRLREFGRQRREALRVRTSWLPFTAPRPSHPFSPRSHCTDLARNTGKLRISGQLLCIGSNVTTTYAPPRPSPSRLATARGPPV